MPTVGIVGAGLIGRAWANVFARAGWDVRLWDPDADALAAAPGLIEEALHDVAKHGLAKDPAAAAKRLKVAASLEEAVAGCRAGAGERAGAARRQARGVRPAGCGSGAECDPRHVVLVHRHVAVRRRAERPASLPGRASGEPAARGADRGAVAAHRSRRRRRSSGRGRSTSSVGQVPIVVKKEIDGFILNRMQAVLLSEAMRLVGEGYVSAEDLDKTIRDGLGLRWAFMGPFETIELNAPGGIPDYCARYGETLYRTSAEPVKPDVWGKDNIEPRRGSWGRAPSPGRHPGKAALARRPHRGPGRAQEGAAESGLRPAGGQAELPKVSLPVRVGSRRRSSGRVRF